MRPANVNAHHPGHGKWSDRAASADANFVWAKCMTNSRRPPQCVNVQEYLVAWKLGPGCKHPAKLEDIFKHKAEYTGPALDYRNWHHFHGLAPGSDTE